MTEGLSIINYKGKNIVYIDYTDFAKDKSTQKEKTMRLFSSATEEYQKHPAKSVLGLVNVENVYFDMDILNMFKNARGKHEPHTKKEATLGIKGLAKAGYNFIYGLNGSDIRKAFNTKEEALEWLVRD